MNPNTTSPARSAATEAAAPASGQHRGSTAGTGPGRYLLLAEFQTPDELLAAARRVRDAGFTRWDTHTPYFVHGLDEAVGIRPTRLPLVVFACGLIGALVALAMQWWMNAVDYPLVISGKPFFSLPANIPIIFELTVLLSAFGAVFGMLAFNKLPRLNNPLFKSARFARATCDRFFISIDAADPRFNERETSRFLRSLPGATVERIEDAGRGSTPRWASRTLVILFCASLIPIVLVARAWHSKSHSPRIHIIQDMDNQEKFQAQQANPLFGDGRAMRPTVLGTVARGELRADEHYHRGRVDGEWAATFPPQVALTASLLRRGQARFNIFCAPCHGLSGRGNGPVSARALELEEPTWVQASSLHDEERRRRPVGHLFNTISNGIRTMPAYGDQIPAADRWAIVAYVRALQRGTSTRVEELPAEKRAELR